MKNVYPLKLHLYAHKRVLQTIFTICIFLFLTEESQSQNCLPEGIIFETQSQIDSFQFNYPGCELIEGYVRILGDDISSLSGLGNLTYIGGSLVIDNCNSLINLNGLEALVEINHDLEIMSNTYLNSLQGLSNLKSVGDVFRVFANTSIKDFAGLDSLITIGSYARVTYNDSLQNLDGLNKLTYIGGSFTIASNDALLDLDGLENLSEINGNFDIGWIGGNPSLVSIEGLENLVNIDGELHIKNNSSLKSLQGLANLNPNSISDLAIYYNDSLSDCDVISLCDYLLEPNGSVTIFSNSQGCDDPYEIAESCGNQIECLPFGNYFFTRQAQIDSFQIHFPACTDLQGYVQIRESDISNLFGLNEVSTIGKGFYITDNALLTNLDGLEGLNAIGDYLIFSENSLLTDLEGLSNLDSIGGSLRITFNDALASLNGLDNIEASTIEGLWIYNNPLLSHCDVLSICNFLNYPVGNPIIEDNIAGCNSMGEVSDSCDANSVLVEEPFLLADLSIYPNPAISEITISGVDDLIEEINVYNHIGQRLIHIINAENTIDVSRLPHGLYIIELKWDAFQIRKKLVIQSY